MTLKAEIAGSREATLEPQAPDLAHRAVALGQGPGLVEQVVAQLGGALDQAVLLVDLEHPERGGAAQGVARVGGAVVEEVVLEVRMKERIPSAAIRPSLSGIPVHRN